MALALTGPLLFNPATVLGQDSALPSCSSVAFDPDGDGFGWDPFAGISCVVTADTGPIPQFTNLETRQAVQLERAYWDPNADLANRDISCRDFTWNEESLSYEAGDPIWFRFAALPSEPPWIAHYWEAPNRVDLGSSLPLMWSVSFGIFTDRTDHFFNEGILLHWWVEPVTTANGAGAVRFWRKQVWADFSEYRECIDPSGESLQATGHWDVPATNLESAYIDTPLYFTGQQEPMPVMVNKQTGQQVMFETGTWELQRDLVYRDITCTEFNWNPVLNEYRTNDFNGVLELEFQPRLIGNDTNSSWLWSKFDGVRDPTRWAVDGQSLTGSPVANSMWFEPISNASGGGRFLLESQEGEQFKGVRYWGQPGDLSEERNQSYHDCYARERPPRGIYSFPANRIDFRPGNSDQAVTPDNNGMEDLSGNGVDNDNMDNTDTESSSVNESENANNADTEEGISDTSSVSGGGGPIDIAVLLAGVLLLRARRDRQLSIRLLNKSRNR